MSSLFKKSLLMVIFFLRVPYRELLPAVIVNMIFQDTVKGEGGRKKNSMSIRYRMEEERIEEMGTKMCVWEDLRCDVWENCETWRKIEREFHELLWEGKMAEGDRCFIIGQVINEGHLSLVVGKPMRTRRQVSETWPLVLPNEQSERKVQAIRLMHGTGREKEKWSRIHNVGIAWGNTIDLSCCAGTKQSIMTIKMIWRTSK